MTKTIWIISIIVTILNSLYLQGQEHQNYPEFSWDHVPLYMHMRKSEAYTQTELQYIATFPLTCLEKTTGSDTYGSTEKGSLAAAKGIKAINPKTKILYYRNTFCHYQNMYDADAGLDTISDPFLIGFNGEVNLHSGVRPLFDLSNAKVRKWWVDHCIEMTNHEEIDGVFFDALVKVIMPGYAVGDIGTSKKQAVLEGFELMMQDYWTRVDSSKLKIGNLIRSNLPGQGLDYMHFFDGSYLELFERDASWIHNSIAATQKAARDGKIICMTLGLDDLEISNLNTSNGYIVAPAALQERFEYCLGLFLICAEEYSYFYFNDGYSVNSWTNNLLWMKRFEEYDKPLGAPLGPAVKNGDVYTREFEHASVWLDVSQEKGTVIWDTDPPLLNLKFQIKDEQGESLSSVRVDVNSKSELSNSSGEVEFDFDNGSYQVTFFKTGYESFVQTYNFDSDSVITIVLQSSVARVEFHVMEGDTYSRYPMVTLNSNAKQASSLGMVVFDDVEKNLSHSYTVEKEGMQTISSTFVLENDTTIEVQLSDATTLHKVENKQIRVYPNPADDFLMLEAQKEIHKVLLVDFAGKIIFSENVSGIKHKIKLPTTTNSFSIVKIEFKDGSTYMERLLQTK